MSMTNEKATLQVSFSKEKLDAMKFYMDEKETTIEKELQLHVKSVYEKYVPAPTRRYLDRNDSEVENQTEEAVESTQIQQEAVISPPSTRGRKRNNKEQAEESAESNQLDESKMADENQELTEESQGMSMTM